MGNQLKQALINAGVVSQEKLKALEKEKLKEKVIKRHLQKGRAFRDDQLRIVCEACQKSAPDVERYAHKNRMIEDKEWLCIPCADQFMIDDACRMTHQSSHAKTGLFRRQYGRTKKF